MQEKQKPPGAITYPKALITSDSYLRGILYHHDCQIKHSIFSCLVRNSKRSTPTTQLDAVLTLGMSRLANGWLARRIQMYFPPEMSLLTHGRFEAVHPPAIGGPVDGFGQGDGPV
jgi:hypothetical protein